MWMNSTRLRISACCRVMRVGRRSGVWAGSHDGGGAGTDYDLFIAKRDGGTEKAASSWQASFLLINHFGVDSGTDMAPSIAVGAETIDVAWESDMIFADRFESSNTAMWSNAVP